MPPVSTEKRASVIAHLKNGISIHKVSKLTGVSKSTVYEIKQEEGLSTFTKNTGRPTKLSPR